MRVRSSETETTGSLCSDVLERRTSNGSGLLAHLGSDFEQGFGQIVSTGVKTLSHTHLVTSRHIKREKRSLPVDARRPKTFLLKLPKNTLNPYIASPGSKKVEGEAGECHQNYTTLLSLSQPFIQMKPQDN